MPPLEGLVYGLRILQSLLGIAALVRLYCTGLHRHFRILFWFLTFNVLQSLVLLATDWFPRPRSAYAWTWVLSEPFMWLFYVLLGLNVYSLVLQDYKGLQTVGRWIFLTAVPLSIGASALTVLPAWNKPHGNAFLFYYTTIDRGVMFSLVIFILVTLLLLSLYPIKLSRNIVMHAVVCTIFLISASMGYFIRNAGKDSPSLYHAVDFAHQVITVLCWSAWLLLLSPKGEETGMILHKWTPEQEERLVSQLTAINSSLMRATRK